MRGQKLVMGVRTVVFCFYNQKEIRALRNDTSYVRSKSPT